MRLRTDHPQMTAAAKAGLSAATARRIHLDPRPPSAKKQRRIWRTRPDPLDGLWSEEIVPPLTAAPGLRPITLFDELARRHPERVGPSFRRTLERRVANWKALHGSNLNVIFPQIQQPGRMGLSDFTNGNGLGVIVGGQPLEHRLYHFALAFSGFEHAEIVLGGESYAALANGLENALRLLGVHFGMVPTRDNRGVAHENGAIESRHGHFKTRIAQALLLRGSSMFHDLEAWRAFVAGVIGQHNRRHAAMIDAERAVLRPLPTAAAMTWEAMTVRVTSASGFMCRHVFYTVPGRLVGHRLHLRIHDDRIEAYLGGSFILTLPRGRRPKGSGVAVHVVDYRHIIAALRAKPGALANLAYRDALWPRTAYRRAWDALLAAGSARDAARTMVGLLALAHDRGVEADLAAAIDAGLDAGEPPDLATMLRRFTPVAAAAAEVLVILPPLADRKSTRLNSRHA